MKRLLPTLLGAVTLAAADHPLAGHKLLVTSLRTGDTEVFTADPVSGDLFNVSRSPASEDRYPCWSPDGRWISFGFTDEAYWRNKERMQEVYSWKPADKRPVWVVRPDGSDAQVLEPLRYQMSIDGSRAPWKPWISQGMGTRE